MATSQSKYGRRVDEEFKREVATMMMLEIVAGHFLHSMALFADGWHMGTHVVALGIAAFAYIYARRHADDARFAFGPGKMGPLGGYTSALILAGVAVYIAFEASSRLLHPLPIQFNEAIAVASLGLGVNLNGCASTRNWPMSPWRSTGAINTEWRPPDERRLSDIQSLGGTSSKGWHR